MDSTIFIREHFVVMLVGFYIEMAMLNTLGKWLDGNDGSSTLVEAGVAIHDEGQQHFLLLLT